MQARQSRCSVTSPSVLGKGTACSSGITPRRTLSKQSLRGQVSVKLTPEICINKASSNSRLTAAGRWASASDSHSQNCLQILLFLPSFDETTTKLHLHAEKLTETVLYLNLGHFVVFYLFGLVFSPLMRQPQYYFWDTISRIAGWGTNTKIIKTETLLHLNLKIFKFLFIYLFYFIFSILSLSP
jgi:hypothetical protein